MKNNADLAVEMHLGGYNCAQSVLSICGQQYGLAKETAIRVGQAFGGGIGRTGNLCGALTGALMAIGLDCSIKNPADQAAKAKAHKMARSVIDKFATRNKTLLCRELTGCDMATEEGMKKFFAEDMPHKVCAKVVRDAVEISQEVVAENKD